MADLLPSPAQRAKAAAEHATGASFDLPPITGYAARSYVFLSDTLALKIYTHRPEDRLYRELHGLSAAVSIQGVNAPRVVSSGHSDDAYAWLVSTRATGTTADQPQWSGPAISKVLGEVAARLHHIPVPDNMPTFKRIVPGRLLGQLATIERPRCTQGFVHGDYSARNVLLRSGALPTVIDFENSGIGCQYDDLATLVTRESILGQRNEEDLVRSYSAAANSFIDDHHLYYHVGLYLAWIHLWAPKVDRQLDERVVQELPSALQRAQRR